MRFSHELFYDAAPETVYAMLVDEEFRSQVCDYQRVLRHRISVEEVDGAVVVDVDQVQSTQYVPATARGFVGSEIEIEQRETWHSPTEATLVVTIPGRPGRMDGRIVLSERDGGTVESVTGEIRVGIPLIGGKLEQMVGQVFGWALDAEARVGADWLTAD
ncbi:MAG: DUF2505 domain-containing protein [Nocardioidaceae bacterium]